ncbi:hypothetical protein Tco_1490812 [Tanacetum coccineum]
MHDSTILEDSLPPKEKDPGSLGTDKFVFPVDFVVLDMPEDIKVSLIRPFLSNAHAKIDVFKKKIALRLRRNQVEVLGSMTEEDEVINEAIEDIVKTRNDDNEISNEIDEYLSFCDYDEKIHIDYAYNLQFSCMIGFEHVNANFFPILSINLLSKRFYNSIMKDKTEYKGENVVGTFMNATIFVGNFYECTYFFGNFSVVTDFAVVENMDAYRDHDMGEVIMGKLFCREICVKARRFDGMIIIYNNATIAEGLNTAYPETWIWRIDFLYRFRTLLED